MVGQGTQTLPKPSLEYDTSTACTYIISATTSYPTPQLRSEAEAAAKRREENMAHERQIWRERRKELRKMSKI